MIGRVRVPVRFRRCFFSSASTFGFGGIPFALGGDLLRHSWRIEEIEKGEGGEKEARSTSCSGAWPKNGRLNLDLDRAKCYLCTDIGIKSLSSQVFPAKFFNLGWKEKRSARPDLPVVIIWSGGGGGGSQLCDSINCLNNNKTPTSANPHIYLTRKFFIFILKFVKRYEQKYIYIYQE